MDCCDTGCKGGWNFNALKFAVNHTVCTLEGFPCTGKGNGTQCDEWEASPCATEKGALTKGSLSGWKSVGGKKWGSTTEADLQSALQLGPVSINMFADSHMAHYTVRHFPSCPTAPDPLRLRLRSCSGSGSGSLASWSWAGGCPVVVELLGGDQPRRAGRGLRHLPGRLRHHRPLRKRHRQDRLLSAPFSPSIRRSSKPW